MIRTALSLVQRNPDPLAFLLAGIMLIAYELEIFVVTEDLLLAAFMIAAAVRSVLKSRSLTAPVGVDLDGDDAEAPDAPRDASE